MGGPAQIKWAGQPRKKNVGPTSAHNKTGPISAQLKNHSLVWARPGPDHRAGPRTILAHPKNISGPEPVWPREEKATLGQHQPGPANWTGGRELFSLPTSCMQKRFCMQEETLGSERKKCRRKKRTWRGGGGRWWCCSDVARERWLRAVLRLFERQRVQLLLFPFSSIWLPLFFGGFLPLSTDLLTFFVCSVLSLLFLSLVRFLSSLSLFPSVFSPSGPPSFSLWVLSIYRKKSEQVCLLLVRLQSRNGWSAIDAFDGGGGEEREAGRFLKMVFVFCCCSNGGKEEDEQCRSKRHRSGLPFFYIYMKRRRFG